MIVIRLEMWPKGDHTKPRSLGIATIANAGGTAHNGEYECRLFKAPEYSSAAETRPIEQMILRPTAKETWKRGRVLDFPRLRLGPWDLLFRALGALICDRSPGVGASDGAAFGGPDTYRVALEAIARATDAGSVAREIAMKALEGGG